MDKNYFNKIDTSEKAYWLGFITADGSVFWNEITGNYGLSLGLGEIDNYHILKLEAALSGERTESNGKLIWYSKEIATSLIKKGVIPQKSYNTELPVPKFPAKFNRHFWRGLFDGDGCITTQTKKPHLLPEYRFSLAGSKPILNAFQDWAVPKTKMNRQKISKAKNQHGEANTFVFYMNGNRQIEAVLNELYRDTDLYLKRKYQFYQNLLLQNSKKNKAKLRYLSDGF